MKAAAVRAMLLLSIVYCVVGILFGTLSGLAASDQQRIAWRWAAWAVSAVAFTGHIAYEQVRLRSSPIIAASHVSIAAALGAFGLAVAANIHARTVAPHPQSLLLKLSLVLWPLITLLPAFVVALAVAIVFTRVRRSI